jgi:hypothetical protein
VLRWRAPRWDAAEARTRARERGPGPARWRHGRGRGGRVEERGGRGLPREEGRGRAAVRRRAGETCVREGEREILGGRGGNDRWGPWGVVAAANCRAHHARGERGGGWAAKWAQSGGGGRQARPPSRLGRGEKPAQRGGSGNFPFPISYYYLFYL